MMEIHLLCDEFIYIKCLHTVCTSLFDLCVSENISINITVHI